MFEENMQIIENNFGEFKGSGMYMALFLMSMLYILLKEENRKNKVFFVFFPIVILFITLNPIFNKLVGRIFTSVMYWRVFWMLPLGITISYGAVKFINSESEKSKKIVATLGVIIIIWGSGTFIFNKRFFTKFGNLYKVPDEVLEVVEIIRNGDEENKKALTSEQLVPYIRQIDANIELAFRREPTGYTNNKFVQTMHSGNSEEIVKLAFENNCNYIVLDRGLVIAVELNYFGFNRIAETNNYIIYRVAENEQMEDK